MKECPYCKEEINDGVIKCTHCNGDIFSEEDNNKRLDRYREREIRWGDKAIEQLGFLNNLLLTLGIAFITLLYGKGSSGIYKCSVFCMSLSTMVGILCALNRLRDFRITRHINTTRRRVYEKQGKLIDGEIPRGYKWYEIFGIFHYIIYEKITTEQLENYKNVESKDRKEAKDKFKNLRRIAHQLGDNTWMLLYAQLLLFSIGIGLFLFMALFKQETFEMLILSF